MYPELHAKPGGQASLSTSLITPVSPLSTAKVDEASEERGGWERQALSGFTSPPHLPLQDKETRTRGQGLPWWSSG